jgi:hypothetical protein
VGRKRETGNKERPIVGRLEAGAIPADKAEQVSGNRPHGKRVGIVLARYRDGKVPQPGLRLRRPCMGEDAAVSPDLRNVLGILAGDVDGLFEDAAQRIVGRLRKSATDRTQLR